MSVTMVHRMDSVTTIDWGSRQPDPGYETAERKQEEMSIPDDADKNISDNLDQAEQRDANEAREGQHTSSREHDRSPQSEKDD